jgi:endonuclease-3
VATTKDPAPAVSARKEQAKRVVRRLKADYPAATCALENETPFQLLIATILSAQCTDERVNIVTQVLFAKYPTAADLAHVPLPKIEAIIKSTGFFRAKAKNLQACSRALVEQYDGEVPQTLEELVALPGVGRKTANVVLGTAYGIPTGVVVDTHVTRLSSRLGLTTHTDAEKIERDLMDVVPRKEWIDFAHRMIWHGRKICIARKPKCSDCSMKRFCPKIGVMQQSSPNE